MKLNKRICIGLLALLIIFHAVNNYLILNNDTTTYSARNALHYLQSIKIRDSPLRIAIMEGYGYPPLYYWSTLPMYLFFGISQDIAARTNIIYFIILIFAVYGIGKELGNRETGLLSALIVSTFCSIFAYSRVYSIDFCLVPLVALAVYFLIKTKELTNRKYSILFGAACGLGMLLKWNFSIYIIGPALYYIIKSFFFSKLIIKKRKTGIGL